MTNDELNALRELHSIGTVYLKMARRFCKLAQKQEPKDGIDIVFDVEFAETAVKDAQAGLEGYAKRQGEQV